MRERFCMDLTIPCRRALCKAHGEPVTLPSGLGSSTGMQARTREPQAIPDLRRQFLSGGPWWTAVE
jgi:hypothetical protein